MKRIGLIVVMMFSVGVMAQAPAPVQKPKYELKENQQDKLEKLQLRAILFSKNQEAAVKDTQDAVAKFYESCDKFKLENKWPADVICNINNLTITDPPPKEVSKETKKEEKK